MTGKEIALATIRGSDFLYYKEFWIGHNEILAYSNILNHTKQVYSGVIPKACVVELCEELSVGMGAQLPFDVWVYGDEYNDYQDRVYHNYTTNDPKPYALTLYNKELQMKTLNQIERDLKSIQAKIDPDDISDELGYKELYNRMLNYGKILESLFGLSWL